MIRLMSSRRGMSAFLCQVEETVEEVADFIVARILDHLGVEHRLLSPYEPEPRRRHV